MTTLNEIKEEKGFIKDKVAFYDFILSHYEL